MASVGETVKETEVVPNKGINDDDYVSTGQGPVPVQENEAPIDDPIDPATADSDETLG